VRETKVAQLDICRVVASHSVLSAAPPSVRLLPYRLYRMHFTLLTRVPQAIGTDPKQEGVRPYTTSIPHGVHCDNSDFVALLCIRDAKAGGLTLWASSVAVHNELLRRGRKVLNTVYTHPSASLPHCQKAAGGHCSCSLALRAAQTCTP
jgi:hypothetical protein